MTNPSRFDWNDLRFLIAVARHGSTIAAGRELGISQSTVLRRIGTLERDIGRPLVVRRASGYRLTPFAAGLIPIAERVEAAVLDVERYASETARAAEGVIRMTCPEPIVDRLMRSEFLSRFGDRHPDLRVDFATSDRYLDLSKGGADVALRSGDTDDDLIGLKVADSHWAVYASRAYLDRNGTPVSIDDLSGHALVGLDESLTTHRAVVWLRRTAPTGRVVARNDSVLGLLHSIKAGVGVGALPTALGDAEPDLVRVLGPISELARSWRLLATEEMRRTPRVSALFDFARANKPLLKPVLTG